MPKGIPNPPLNFDCLKPRIPLAVVDALKTLAEKWRKPHEDCKEDNHVFDCFCSVYDDCADELENEIHKLAEKFK
jgi:hypothetical protein